LLLLLLNEGNKSPGDPEKLGRNTRKRRRRRRGGGGGGGGAC
jgi:hypothetical protein